MIDKKMHHRFRSRREERNDAFSRTKRAKRIKHYNSNQKILLIGEGNFSFAACLSRSFVSADNLIATSLDSGESVMDKYSYEAWRNLKELEERGCLVLHRVDAHFITQHYLLANQHFDRVVFNFPHAGFFHREDHKRQIYEHQHLVRGFFANATKLLRSNGEIHVTHKTSYPYSEWEIVKLAREGGLHLVEVASFSTKDYPGYMNTRGSGKRCNQTFHVGKCRTDKFAKLPPQEFSFPLRKLKSWSFG